MWDHNVGCRFYLPCLCFAVHICHRNQVRWPLVLTWPKTWQSWSFCTTSSPGAECCSISKLLLLGLSSNFQGEDDDQPDINLINNVKESNSEVQTIFRQVTNTFLGWNLEHQTRLKWPRQGDPTVFSGGFHRFHRFHQPGPKRSHHCSTWELFSSTVQFTAQLQLGAIDYSWFIPFWRGIFFWPNLTWVPTEQKKNWTGWNHQPPESCNI